jgi:hypothetical protein
MTPKEKADELLCKFINQWFAFGDYLSLAKAKQCALIAIDELIYFSSNQTLSIEFYGDYYCDYDFFVEVKQEIEKL